MPDEGGVEVPAELAELMANQLLEELDESEKEAVNESVLELDKCLDDGEDPTIKAIEINNKWADDCVLAEFMKKLNEQLEFSLRTTCAKMQTNIGNGWREEFTKYLYRVMAFTFFCTKCHKIDFDDLPS